MSENSIETEQTNPGQSLFRVKSLQFIYFFALGSALPFFFKYYYDILVDVNGVEMVGLISLITAFQSIIGIIAPPLSGYLADKFRIHKQILTLGGICTALGPFLIAVPGFLSIRPIGPGFIILLFAGITIQGLALRPLMPIIDTECLNDLRKKTGQTKSYGSIRLWGSIGWAIATVAGGTVLYLSKQPNAALLVYAGGFLFLGLYTIRGIKAKVQKVQIPWEKLFKDKKFFLFLIFIFLSSYAIGSSFMFTAVYLDEQNLSTIIIGLSFGISAMVEVPLFILAPKLLKTFGDKWLIILGAIFLTLKLIFFGILNNNTAPVIFFLVQLLHGVGYSFFFAGAIHFMDSRSHHSLKTTYQSFYYMAWGLGTALGNFLNPKIKEIIGVNWIMGSSAIVLGCAALYAIFAFKNSKEETT